LTGVTVTGTTTITDVTTTTRVACKDWDGQSAEALASEANATEVVSLNGTPGSSKRRMKLLSICVTLVRLVRDEVEAA